MNTEAIFQELSALPKEAQMEALDFIQTLTIRYKAQSENKQEDEVIKKRLELFEKGKGTINVPVDPNETYSRESIYGDDGR